MSCFEVGIVGTFAAHHHLVGDFGPASRDHAHTYRVEATVTGETLASDGTLFDITHVQRALDAVSTELGSQDLNAVAGLASPNPTAEVVARYVFERVAASLRQAATRANERRLRRLSVRVWESAEAFAGYADDLT